MKLAINPILNVDIYKMAHIDEYPKDTAYIYSTIIARKPNDFMDYVVAMGHTYVIKEYLCTQITYEMIDEAQEEAEQQGYDFNYEAWEYIVEKHNGYMPLEIRAVPEGTHVPCGCVIATIVNTDPKCFWLPSFVETVFQRSMWKFTTVATTACGIRNVLLEAAIETGADESYVEYALHNFGDRGADSTESAIIAAIAHATSFSGSDCAQANRYIKYFYNTRKAYTSSVEASEHSVMCAHSDATKRDDFKAAVALLDRLELILDKIDAGKKLAPIVSIVGDTYNIFRFASEYLGTILKDRIIALGARGGKVVLRPDSGNPLTVPIKILELLADAFGYTVNAKGYKVLPSYIGVIQGDGINQDSIRQLIANVKKAGFCISNIVFGMGGGLTHGAGRDEFSFAQKATSLTKTSGEQIDLFKDPVTDSGKRSLTGEVTTFYAKDSNRIFSDRISLTNINHNIVDMLKVAFRDGKIYNEQTYDEVRELARAA